MPENLTRTVTRGAFWMLGMRWSMRFLGLISTAILARILTPEDFGVVAVSAAFIGLLDAFSTIGSEAAIIRHPNPKRVHYDTVWTLSILIHLLSAIIIVLMTPVLTNIYGDERYGEILYVLALSILFSGFKNIGIVDFQRNFEFKKDFSYAVVTQFSTVIITVTLALIIQTYWALVIGMVFRSLVGLAFSFVMHPYRPRLSLGARKEMISFSGWQSLRAVSFFFIGNGQRLILGAFYSPTIIGLYAVASDLSRISVGEVVAPIGRAILPGLSKIQNDSDWVARTFPRVINITATISFALGVGVSAVAEDFVNIVLGEKFHDAVQLLELLAIAIAIRAFMLPVSQYLVVADKMRELALIYFVEAIVAVSIIIAMASHGFKIEDIAFVNILISMFAAGRLFFFIKEYPDLKVWSILVSLLRPILASLVMYSAVQFLEAALDIPSIFRLPILVIFGAIIFSGATALFWFLFGRPQGIETEVYKYLSEKMNT